MVSLNAILSVIQCAYDRYDRSFAEPVQGTVFHVSFAARSFFLSSQFWKLTFLLSSQGDGREQALLKHLQTHPDLQNNPGPQPVLDAIHEFGKKHYLMSVGDTKGQGVEKIIQEREPKVRHS